MAINNMEMPDGIVASENTAVENTGDILQPATDAMSLLMPANEQEEAFEEYDVAASWRTDLGINVSGFVSSILSGDFLTGGKNTSLFKQVEKKRIEKVEKKQQLEEALFTEEGKPAKVQPRYVVQKIDKKTWGLKDDATGEIVETFNRKNLANKRKNELRPKPDAEEQPILSQAADDVEDSRIVSAYNQRTESDTRRVIEATNEDAAVVINSLLEPKRTELISGGLSDFSEINKGTGKYEKRLIPDESSVIAGIEATSQRYKGKITEETRGVVTQEAQRQLADMLGVSDKNLINAINKRQMGGVINIEGMGLAETMLAARDLLVTESAKLDKLAVQAVEGGAKERLLFKRQLTLVANIQAQIKGSQTEIARALGQFNIPSRNLEGKDASKILQDDLDRLANEFGGEGDLKDLAKMYLEAPEGSSQRLKVTRELSKFKKLTAAAYEMWINALLSNPVTHFKNTVGTFLTTFATIPTTAIAAAGGTVRRQVFGQEGGVYWGEVQAALFASMAVQRETFKLAAGAYKGADTIGGSQLTNQQRKHAFSAEAFGTSGFIGQTTNILGNIFTMGRAPTRALQFEDAFWKVTANRMELYKLAYRDAMNKGLKQNHEAFANHMADFIENPPAYALEQGETIAKYVALQADLGPTGRSWQKSINKTRGARWFIPFFKTPTNMIKYVRDHTPAGFWFGEQAELINKGGAEADVARARIALGTGVAFYGFTLATEGRITGGGPIDKEQRQAMEKLGWQPYSVRVGDKYYSIQGAEPWSSMFMLLGDLNDVAVSGEANEEEIGTIITSMVASFGYMMTNKTMMSGFANLLDSIRDPANKGEKALNQFQKSLIPSGMAQLNRVAFDNSIKDTQGLIENVKSRLPYFSKDVPARRNIWGEKMFYNPALGPDFISPIYMSTIKENPINDEIVNEKIGISAHPDQYRFRGQESGADPIVLQNNDLKDLFHKRSGEIALELLTEEILTADGKSLNNNYLERKKDSPNHAKYTIQKAFRDARDLAAEELLMHEIWGPILDEKIKYLNAKYLQELEAYQNQ